MSLAYPGPYMEVIDVVGQDAFLEALGDPELRLQILDKVPATMDEALCIALNLEALDKSKETQKKAMEPCEKPSDEEPRRKKETCSFSSKVSKRK